MLSVHRSKGHNTRLTINLTGNSVTDPEFIQWLSVAIKAARLPSDAVIFQITEPTCDRPGSSSRVSKAYCRASLSALTDQPFEVLKHIPVSSWRALKTSMHCRASHRPHGRKRVLRPGQASNRSRP